MDYSKHLETTGHFEALGKVGANFSLLEHSLRALLWAFFNKDTILTDVISSQLSYQRLLSCVTGLANHKLEPGKKLTSLLDLLDEAGKLEQERNSIVHSMWLPRGDQPHHKPYAIRYKPVVLRKGKLKPQVDKVDADKLILLADRMYSCSESLLKIKYELAGE